MIYIFINKKIMDNFTMATAGGEYWPHGGCTRESCGEDILKIVLNRLGLITSLSLLKSLPFDVYECATASDEDWECLRDAFTPEQAQRLRRECRIELIKANCKFDEPEKKSNTEKNRKKREKRKEKKREKKKTDQLEKDLAEKKTRKITIRNKEQERLDRQVQIICKLHDENQALNKKIEVMQAVSKIRLDKLDIHMDNLKVQIDNTSRCNGILLNKLVEEGYEVWLKDNGQTYNYKLNKC